MLAFYHLGVQDGRNNLNLKERIDNVKKMLSDRLKLQETLKDINCLFLSEEIKEVLFLIQDLEQERNKIQGQEKSDLEEDLERN